MAYLTPFDPAFLGGAVMLYILGRMRIFCGCNAIVRHVQCCAGPSQWWKKKTRYFCFDILIIHSHSSARVF